MKRKLLLLIVAWLPVYAYCDKVTVHLDTEGTLEEVINSQEVQEITDLTITGRITAADIKYLRNCSGRIATLESLDLKDVTLVASEEPYYWVNATMFTAGYGYYLSDKDYAVYPISSAVKARSETRGSSVVLGVFGMHLGYAFYKMPWKKVVLPSMVKKVGNNCFAESSIEVVEAPGATTICSQAFYGAQSLQSFTSNHPLETIESGAFSFCSSLKSIDLGNVTEIARATFSYCTSLEYIDLSNVTKINYAAFYGCCSLTSVGSISKVNYFDEHAFSECSKLQGKIEFGTGLVEIPARTFEDCSSITELVFPTSLKTIGYAAFSGCSSIVTMTFPYECQLETIDDKAFFECKALASLTLSEGVLSIGASAFANCNLLEEVSLPSTLREVQLNSFSGTPWQNLVALEDDGMMVIGNVAVAYYIDDDFEPNTTLEFREGISGIGDNFEIVWRDPNKRYIYSSNYVPISTKNITDIKFPSTLQCIGSNSFAMNNSNEKYSSYTGLTKLTLPSSLKKIGDYAFPSTIESINFPEGLEEIGAAAFLDCSNIEEIILPSTLKRLGREAFGNCIGLSEITIPESVEKLEAGNSSKGDYVGPFGGCKGIVTVRMNARNLAEGSQIGPLEGLENFIIGSKVEVLPDRLMYLTFPNNVMFEEHSADSKLYIGRASITYSFEDLNNTSLSLPNCKISLGEEAFAGFNLSLEIPGEITEMGERALSDCTGLTSVRLSDELTEIPIRAFDGCSGLTSVSIPASVTSMGYSAFHSCTDLGSVTISANLTTIESGVFADCRSLTSVTIPNSVTSINYGVFSGCI